MRSIGHTLNTLTDIRPLMERVQALMALQKRYARSIPPELAVRSRITHERGGMIHVQADTAAVAAKLRNLSSRIFEELRSEWPNLTGIHIGTQPTPAPDHHPRTLPSLDEEGRRQLKRLGDTLPDGPLKKSLLRWSRR